jgi:hypothetical protein
MRWINNCKNITFNLNNFYNQYIICAGTILGNYNGIITFLMFIDKCYNKEITNDQAIFNIFIYNYFTNKNISHYKKSRILTLDRLSPNQLNITNNKIYNDYNEIYAIIHQIDRCDLNLMLSLV